MNTLHIKNRLLTFHILGLCILICNINTSIMYNIVFWKFTAKGDWIFFFFGQQFHICSLKYATFLYHQKDGRRYVRYYVRTRMALHYWTRLTVWYSWAVRRLRWSVPLLQWKPARDVYIHYDNNMNIILYNIFMCIQGDTLLSFSGRFLHPDVSLCSG